MSVIVNKKLAWKDHTVKGLQEGQRLSKSGTAAAEAIAAGMRS